MVHYERFLPPLWMKSLDFLPKYIVKLGNTPTPIERWHVAGIPKDFSIDIKRDDMTGIELSGNKVRKLEFLLADALSNGYKHVITCGALQSNHCRATAFAATKLGLKCHLFYRSNTFDPKEIPVEGNFLLCKMLGTPMYLASETASYETELKPRMEQLASKISEKYGEKAYIIPIGGSNVLGAFGYMCAFEECLQTGLLEDYSDIVVCCGSGGTAEGVAIANFLCGSKLKIHAFTVTGEASYFYHHGNKILRELGFGNDIRFEDLINIVDGAVGLGYGLSTTDEIDFISSVVKDTGIILDPVYTGKSVFGMMKKLQCNQEMFLGKKLLYIHTGGTNGVLHGAARKTIASQPISDIISLPNVNNFPDVNV